MAFNLEQFSRSASSTFPTANVDASRPEFGHIHLRFELGFGNPNGSEERILQSTERAVTLFDECITEDDSVVMMANDFSCEDLTVASEVNGRYLMSLVDGFGKNGLVRQVNYLEEDENCIEQELSFRQLLLRTRPSGTNYRKIFQGITHLEQGRDPFVHEDVYFYNETRNIVFYMYDDRGCLIWANKPETLAFLYSKYNDWLVDHHREHFDMIWGNLD